MAVPWTRDDRTAKAAALAERTEVDCAAKPEGAGEGGGGAQQAARTAKLEHGQ